MTPITLAAIYNLSGGQAGLDRPSWQGARLAVAQANEGGGVLGRPVELVLVNSGTDPAALGGMTAQLLVDQPSICALFGLSDTDMVLAAATSCAAVERLFVTSGATSPHLPQQVPTYLYLACFGDNVQAAAAAEFAYNELGARRAAAFYRRNDTFTELLQGYFTTRFDELGGHTLRATGYESLDEVTGWAAELPPTDVVFFSAAPDDVIAGISRMRAAGVSAPIVAAIVLIWAAPGLLPPTWPTCISRPMPSSTTRTPTRRWRRLSALMRWPTRGKRPARLPRWATTRRA